MVESAAGPPAEPLPDLPALLGGLTELVEYATAGAGGLPGLQLTVELAQAVTGALGATFVEYSRSGGRIVVATAALSWALGRPVEVTEPAIARLLACALVQDVDIRQLSSRGVRRVVRAGAVADGAVIGAVQVYYADAEPAPEYHRGVVRLLAACAAHLYRESPGLPVYPDGPVLTPLAQGMAVVGPDFVVRSWSPSAARLTGRSFEEAIGRPLPFAMPPPGQVVVHRLDGTRWVRLRAAALSGTDATVVTFRETSGPEPVDQARDLFIAVTSH